jgi:hypothetical protein
MYTIWQPWSGGRQCVSLDGFGKMTAGNLAFEIWKSWQRKNNIHPTKGFAYGQGDRIWRIFVF